MPRTGRGGRRRGEPGKAYPQRTDLMAQPVRTAPSQTYGDAAAQERAQRAIPLPQQAPPGMGAPAPEPFVPTPLGAPSARPDEPLTAGLPVGAGPGPNALIPSVDPVVETLRAAYRAFPNEAIAAVLERAEASQR